MTRPSPCGVGAPVSERPEGTPQHRRASCKEGRMSYFVGLDWASQEHAVCVINERAQIVWHTTIPHTAVGLAELRTRLARLRSEERRVGKGCSSRREQDEIQTR